MESGSAISSPRWQPAQRAASKGIPLRLAVVSKTTNCRAASKLRRNSMVADAVQYCWKQMHSLLSFNKTAGVRVADCVRNRTKHTVHVSMASLGTCSCTSLVFESHAIRITAPRSGTQSCRYHRRGDTVNTRAIRIAHQRSLRRRASDHVHPYSRVHSQEGKHAG